jgi:hypothetical protein
MAVTLAMAGGGELPVAGSDMLGHLFFKDLFQNSFDAFWEAGFYISLHDLLTLFLGQVSPSSLGHEFPMLPYKACLKMVFGYNFGNLLEVG